MTPYWFNAKLPEFPPLNQDIEVDVAVIGGGLTGITAAWLLHKAGKKVALLERQRCAAADTGHTTAHLTFVTDTRLHEVVQKFGRDGAKAFWDGGAVAIDQIDELVRSEHIDCEFQWVPGYLHAALAGSDRAERSSLEQDAALANELGFQAKFLLEVPYAKRMGVRFEHQAQFHPRKYLAGLLQRLAKGGAGVYENSEVSAVENDPLTVRVGSHKVRCGYLVIATHCPIMGKTSLVSATLFQTKLALYTSYVLGARLPRDTVPQALYWDTSNPYYYLRIEKQSDHDYVIFGGEDSKTGQEQDAPAIFAKLERTLQQVLPGAHVQDRWLGQVVETNDGLPFIGESSASQFIATGFCGNGFTLGTLAAQMARDRVLGRKNPWFDLFDIGRKKILGGTWRYITENVDYPYYLLRDRLAKADVSSPDAIPFGEGRIAKLDGRKVAAYRDQAGKLHSLSPVCTHLGCIVHWNAADGTWDCPCHGSRFKPTGEVLSGPAEAPLGKAENT